MPVHAITGDHDRKAGSLDLFRRYMEPELHRAVRLRSFDLFFLNAMDGADKKEFDLSNAQVSWLESKLRDARAAGQRPVIFNHLYPSELATKAGLFTRLIREFDVELVEMGHTHYNELANDERTIYAVTRSTGQIEEGPPGFSVTNIDEDVVSWKFKQRGAWPFVMITLPSDQALITRPKSPRHVVRGEAVIRAKAWAAIGFSRMECAIDNLGPRPMEFSKGLWELPWDSRDAPDGPHRIVFRAMDAAGGVAEDEITVCVNQMGHYAEPVRSRRDYENPIGAYPAKQIFGTQLGPNEFCTKGPWPSWRNKKSLPRPTE